VLLMLMRGSAAELSCIHSPTVAILLASSSYYLGAHRYQFRFFLEFVMLNLRS
jgi:hypothetical protein